MAHFSCRVYRSPSFSIPPGGFEKYRGAVPRYVLPYIFYILRILFNFRRNYSGTGAREKSEESPTPKGRYRHAKIRCRPLRGNATWKVAPQFVIRNL